MYCAVDEAYDGDANTRINDKYERHYNNQDPNHQDHNDNQDIETFDNYGDIDITQNNNNNIVEQAPIFPAFFTAQGDYSTQGPYYGTTINDLKDDPDKNNNKDNDSFSILDSDFTNDSLFLPKQTKKIQEPKKKIDHDYYIDKMVKSLLEDHDSLASSQNNFVYIHVKSCKYCKDRINEKMKKHFQQDSLEIPTNLDDIKRDKQDKKDIKEYFDMTNIGYDLKEILIIILAGIVLVFILDLLVKIGRRMK